MAVVEDTCGMPKEDLVKNLLAEMCIHTSGYLRLVVYTGLEREGAVGG